MVFEQSGKISHINDVHAFDACVFAVVETVGDHARFFAVGPLNDQVVNTQTGIFVLNFSDDRFDEFPVVFAGQFSICEGSGDAVVTEFTVEDVREAGGGGLTEGSHCKCRSSLGSCWWPRCSCGCCQAILDLLGFRWDSET
jgi:hypothetical protein